MTKSRRFQPWAVLALLLAAGCEDATPTTGDETRLPVEAVTLEVRLPWEAFATDFQRFEGFGTAAALPITVLAHEWGGVEARALARFGGLPRNIFVRPPGSPTTTPDSLYVPISGELRIRFDTLAVQGVGPFEVEAHGIEEGWHPPSANWAMAVDTVGGASPWTVPGGGPDRFLSSAAWDPTATIPGEEEDDEPIRVDWVTLSVDSASVARWVQTDLQDRGLRLGLATPESRLVVRSIDFTVHARSSVNPDTIVAIPVGLQAVTFLSDPAPEVDESSFVVGGTPAGRATLRLTLPETIPGTAEACALVSCPIELLPERIVYAGLELQTRAVEPVGLRPLGPIVIELRPVLDAGRLPRSPLGFPLACPTGQCPMVLPSTTVEEEDFTSGAPNRIDFPMTRYVRDLLRPTEAGAPQVPSTVAILNGLDEASGLEIRPLQVATFWGPGSELAPVLRLVVTVSTGVPAP